MSAALSVVISLDSAGTAAALAASSYTVASGNGRNCQAMPTASASEAAMPNATGQRGIRLRAGVADHDHGAVEAP